MFIAHINRLIRITVTAESANDGAPRLTYVADPMCSWCFAFGPELATIIEETGLVPDLVMGGLFVGPNALRLDRQLRSYLDETWDRVSAACGRPIDRRHLERSDWVYDTEPSCRAVVAVRRMDPDVALPFFSRLQQAFYVDGVDLANPDEVASLATTFGLDELGARRALADPEICAEDFGWARSRGIGGFPTLVLHRDGEAIVVSAGYRRAAPVLRTIKTLLGG